MKTSFLFPCFLVSAALIAGTARPAAAADTVFKFSDPAKPGRVIVQVGLGDVSIVGEDTNEVRVSSDDDVQSSSQPRDNGFRVLNGGSGFSAAESNNVITITAAGMFPGKGGRHGDSTDVSVRVPRQTSVTIERHGPGDMEVHDVTGDLEIRGAIGDIELAGMGGGVIIESINGDVEASLAALKAGKPVSISVVHGDVELTIPANAKANVELSTLQGEILTNFSEDQLKTRFEDGAAAVDGVEMSVDAEKARKDAEKARKQAEKDARQAEKDAQRAAADAAAAQGQAGRPGMPPMPPMPPMPSMPQMPSMPGGKPVVGKLNGGGTELTVVTITGDITLQKAE